MLATRHPTWIYDAKTLNHTRRFKSCAVVALLFLYIFSNLAHASPLGYSTREVAGLLFVRYTKG
jgi:hypothetical protein